MDKRRIAMKRKVSMISYAILFLLSCVSISAAQAQTPQQTLNQYIADLQKNPGDYAMREKIIKHVQTMKPAPAIPEEARRQYIMGKTLFEDAKSVQDFKDSIEKLRKALLIAPWWPDANRDLGMALQGAQEYSEAIRALKLFIATNPGEELFRRAQNEIYKIEAKQEKAAKESSPAAMAEKKRQEEGAFLKKIDGARYKYYYSGSRDAGYWIFDIRGNQVITGFVITSSRFSPEDVGRYERDGMAPLNGREFTLTSDRFTCSFRDNDKTVEKGRISDDGESITTQVCNETRTYRRER
jgi:tetratricopeptide (TPR) repeat protein